MSTEFRNNHYVPVWYQKRFIPSGQTDNELFYLELKPGRFTDGRGVKHERTGIHRWGPKRCFREEDLYTTYFGSEAITEVEQVFFGAIDQHGKGGVEYFAGFSHPSVDYDALRNMLLYLGTQKLRTPKGLGWLRDQAGTADRDTVLRLMTKLRGLYSAIWMECTWLIADASCSETKFIISDHPVTVYNRICGPRSSWCRGYNDPDVRFQGSHTVFPLSLEKILILTNLSWVRNPYQLERSPRPNPNLFRPAVFNYTDIQTLRHLDEQEVREINFVIKNRAHRYIGAGRKEWLYPERHVSKSKWRGFGHGYLFMPDPRPVDPGGEWVLGFRDGSVASYDAYGRSLGQPDYNIESESGSEMHSLYRFKGEFARLFGPFRRGRAYDVPRLDPERDSDDRHQYHLDLEGVNKREMRRVRR